MVGCGVLTAPEKRKQNKMKKLMIAAAIVCAAAMSQAASCAWANEWAYAIDESHPTYADSALLTGKYVILLGATEAAVTVSNDGTISYDTVAFTQVDAGTFENNFFGKTLTGIDPSNNGKYLTMICYSSDYQIDGKNIYGVGSVALAGAAGEPAPADFDDVTFANDGGGYFVLNQAAAVPEPTSGLLLLLGVAGLALRRRRA